MEQSTRNAVLPPLPPAPGGEFHPSLELANSAVIVPGAEPVDLLATPAEATRWLVDHDLAPADVELQHYCSTLLMDLRQHVRGLFKAAVDRAEPPVASLRAVNDALLRTPTAALLGWDPQGGWQRVAPHPTTQIVEHALASLAVDVAELVTDSEADRLAACEAAPCNRFFVRTHARRRWCSTRCGDRVRAARAYARRSGAPTPS
ncbi:CGNR zinc finger domain-containing protein [Citricoccus alkalitolerans]|uniref:CGNR zinc finger domain-containing protein n=1 Tax=Citricoccus alkalitolerans TaxID=246603 RepID=A0ABV8XW64_9MICC